MCINQHSPVMQAWDPTKLKEMSSSSEREAGKQHADDDEVHMSDELNKYLPASEPLRLEAIHFIRELGRMNEKERRQLEQLEELQMWAMMSLLPKMFAMMHGLQESFEEEELCVRTEQHVEQCSQQNGEK